MEELMAAMVPEEEEGDDLPVYVWTKVQRHFKGKKRWRVLLQFDRKLFDGELDEIKGIFQSSQRHFQVFFI